MSTPVPCGRWYVVSQSHSDLMNELVQEHIRLINAMKPRSMGGPNDFLADSALRRMRDIVNQLCHAVELPGDPVVFCCSIDPNTE